MFICLCNGITDSQIRRAASDGMTSLDAIQDKLGVASQCGQCSEAAVAVLADVLAASETSTTPLFYAADTWATA